MRLLPVLLLLTCACGAPTRYAQGVPVPRPPVFSPVTDSPITVGQPGHTGARALPRSPHQRELPPPGDWPGVWGADPPTASATLKPTSYPKVFGFDMVMEDREDDTETRAAGLCVSLLKDARLLPPWLDEAMGMLTPEERRCAAAYAYAVCINNILSVNVALATQDATRPTERVASLERAAAATERARKAACDGADPAALGPVISALIEVVDAHIPRGAP